MKKLILSLCLMTALLTTYAADTVYVRQQQIPILIERHDNVLIEIRVNTLETKQLESMTLTFSDDTPIEQIKAVKLYYSGVEAPQDRPKQRFAPVEYIPSNSPGKTLEANHSYSVLKSIVGAGRVPARNESHNENVGATLVVARNSNATQISKTITLQANQQLFVSSGKTDDGPYMTYNYFWVSLEMKPDADLQTKVTAQVTEVKADGKTMPLKVVSGEINHRMAVGVRHAGDDGSAAFRIPGLVTTNNGTLLGVYDVRYNNSVDLQEHVDIGLSRSTDGGKTWEKMRLPLAFGEDGGLPAAQNGVGDPSILVDTQTNTVWIVAAWVHGMGNQRAWWSSHQGMDKYITAQLMMTKSTDDGKTWSEPINVTEQVKQEEWYFLLQGPGRGITMADGTLVFPIQYIDKTRIPNAGIMFSKDHGETWTIHNHARTNTTEAQVAEVEPGVLMLNMRDNRGGSRAVYTTNDLGQTWKEHESSRTALIEPVCMASIISVKAEDNVLGKDLLIFSNPNSTSSRKDITIKISIDGGYTWQPDYQLLLDEGYGWGYTCLTMIDRETVGILYESSVAHMTFQAVKLTDIVKYIPY